MHLTHNMLNKIKSLSYSHTSHNKTSHKAISIKNTQHIAKMLNVSTLAIEIKAIENKIIPERYIRNMETISYHDQLKLLKAHICIVGLGGLGSMVLENLLRIGISNFRLIDGDIFKEHNLNRQILSSINNIGQLKTDVAIKHMKEINPSASILAFPKYLTKKNCNFLINNCEITVDCLDNIDTRFILETESKKKKIPMVSAATAGTTGHITTIFPEDKGLELIFGKQEKLKKNSGAEVTLGCLPHVVNTIASIECNEIIKIVLGAKTLRNKLLIIDLEDYTFETLALI